MEDYLILSGLWLLYGVIHSLFASNRMKRFFQAWTGPWYRYYRITFSFFSIILLIPVLWYQSGIPSRMLYEQHVATVFSGLALATAGIMIVKISFEQYDLHEFIGMRQMKGENNGQSMQQEGMLSFVRHPLYSGSILAILGYLIFAPSLTNLIMGMILVLYFITGIYFEEKKLVIEFGEKYIRYKGQVPALLPSWKKIFRQHKNPKKK